MERTASLPYAPAEHATAPISIAGFNHSRRATDPDNNLFAALLAIASHDLRQPLQVIRGAHDILAKALNGVVERVQLARVENATSKLGDTLDQLVDALRMFDPASSARSEIVQLGPLFTLLNAELAEAASRKGLTLRIMPTRIAVSSNTVLLGGILRNLIGNAINYTPAGGRVLVAARRREAAIQLEVRDNGVGISNADLTAIFKPFHRAENARTSGLGLGLFIVKSAAAFLGHRIEVHSELGRGSRFVIVANHAPLDAIAITAGDSEGPLKALIGR